jgi:hypothetical protein
VPREKTDLQRISEPLALDALLQILVSAGFLTSVALLVLSLEELFVRHQLRHLVRLND